MKKYLGIFLAAILCVMLAVAASAADVYVNDGGTGDGSSASAPLGDMSEAILKIAADGGKVIIVETYTCAEEYHEPEHTGNIVITGGTYVFTNGSYNRWFLSGSGSTTFENMTFEYGVGTTGLIIAQYNELILGDGLAFPTDGKCYIVGGYQLPLTDTAVFDKDSHITIKSGNYWAVAGHSRGNGEYGFTGTSNITVEGGEIATLYGASINGNYSGNAVINVTGGTINNLRTAGDVTRRLNGDCIVNISGGMITLLSINNVMGKATVNFSGGAIANAEKTVEPAIAIFVVDGMATLNATPNVDAKLAAIFFDQVNYVSSIPTTSITPPTTTEASQQTTVLAETTATPVVTTAAPVVTTAAPVVTTAAPVVTTAAPVVTTAAPVEITVAPVETDVAPAETNAPETTSAPAPDYNPGSDAETGVSVGLIIGIVLAAIVVVVVVIIVIKKKK